MPAASSSFAWLFQKVFGSNATTMTASGLSCTIWSIPAATVSGVAPMSTLVNFMPRVVAASSIAAPMGSATGNEGAA